MMGKETELKRIKSEWDKLNLEEIDHETSKIAELLFAKAGGKSYSTFWGEPVLRHSHRHLCNDLS